MSNNLEIIKSAIDGFKKIQEYMAIAKEENATRTYEKLKGDWGFSFTAPMASYESPSAAHTPRL